ncbi:hypothetical protein R84B8_02803 [Treponema sp. R8-4-B8]
MPKTIQPCSFATLCETSKRLTIEEAETKNDLRPLLSLYDNLNNLYEKLCKLDYLFQRKIIEQGIYIKGEKK